MDGRVPSRPAPSQASILPGMQLTRSYTPVATCAPCSIPPPWEYPWPSHEDNDPCSQAPRRYAGKAGSPTSMSRPENLEYPQGWRAPARQQNQPANLITPRHIAPVHIPPPLQPCCHIPPTWTSRSSIWTSSTSTPPWMIMTCVNIKSVTRRRQTR